MTLEEIFNAIDHETEMVAQNFVMRYDAFAHIDSGTYFIYSEEIFSGHGQKTEMLRTRNLREFLLTMERCHPEMGITAWSESPGWGNNEQEVA